MNLVKIYSVSICFIFTEQDDISPINIYKSIKWTDFTNSENKILFHPIWSTSLKEKMFENKFLVQLRTYALSRKNIVKKKKSG